MHGHAKRDGDGGFGSMHFTASFLFHQTTNTHSLGRGSHLAITDTSSKALLVISVTENYNEGSIKTERCSLMKKKNEHQTCLGWYKRVSSCSANHGKYHR